MSLPDPTIRPDAVDHWAALLGGGELPSEALCLTLVRGVPVADALVRFGGVADGREVALDVAGAASVAAFPDELPIVVADDLAGWTFLAEDNGFHGSLPEVVARLSTGTVAASAYWNVNFDSRITLAHDGRVLAAVEFAANGPVTGADPAAITPFLDGLDFSDPYRTCAAALAFLERVSGVRVPAGWSSAPHPASVVFDAGAIDRDDPRSWLSVNAPHVVAAMSHTAGSTLRALCSAVAARACTATGVDDPLVRRALAEDVESLSTTDRAERREELADRAREHYLRALSLRFDRCAPEDPGLDAAAVLRSAVRRRTADRSPEDDLVVRAHALGAMAARFADDPVDALCAAAFNACQADRAGWPALLDTLTAGVPDRT
ncbi:MAG TPA: DUF6461 domain-containing protein [Umezawaea sp.]|nr:DUF6461 domain-containing protein [Umezawaea sp.]